MWITPRVFHPPNHRGKGAPQRFSHSRIARGRDITDEKTGQKRGYSPRGEELSPKGEDPDYAKKGSHQRWMAQKMGPKLRRPKRPKDKPKKKAFREQEIHREKIWNLRLP